MALGTKPCPRSSDWCTLENLKHNINRVKRIPSLFPTLHSSELPFIRCFVQAQDLPDCPSQCVLKHFGVRLLTFPIAAQRHVHPLCPRLVAHAIAVFVHLRIPPMLLNVEVDVAGGENPAGGGGEERIREKGVCYAGLL